MNIIGLLDHPSSGTYKLNEHEIASYESDELAELRNRYIGFVFQSFFLLPRLSALQNVMLPLVYRNLPRDQRIALAMNKLEKVGMADLTHHTPNQLSGGQQQRVAIARALVGEPKVILADEPTGALDAKTSQEVMNLLINLNQDEGVTIVIVTHDEEVASQCKKIYRVSDGRLIQDAH
jgi:putative ABC transport system ATP-binding protein